MNGDIFLPNPFPKEKLMFRANVGLDYPRAFHSTSALLGLFGPTPTVARKRYREWVREWRGWEGLDPSSNDGVQRAT